MFLIAQGLTGLTPSAFVDVEMPSKLQLTYARYKAEAARLQRELADIRTKMAVLEEAGAVDEDQQPSLAIGVPSDHAEPEGLTERIHSVVASLFPGVWASKSEIIELILKAGYIPKGKHYKISAFKALQRLREQGKIRGRMEGNQWLFSSLER